MKGLERAKRQHETGGCGRDTGGGARKRETERGKVNIRMSMGQTMETA